MPAGADGECLLRFTRGRLTEVKASGDPAPRSDHGSKTLIRHVPSPVVRADSSPKAVDKRRRIEARREGRWIGADWTSNAPASRKHSGIDAACEIF